MIFTIVLLLFTDLAISDLPCLGPLDVFTQERLSLTVVDSLSPRGVPGEATSQSKESGKKTKKTKLTSEQREERKQMLPVVWLLLFGVSLLGGIMILLIFLFGSRARRIARKPLPAAPLRNPLWYLKPQSKPLSESSNEPPETDQK